MAGHPIVAAIYDRMLAGSEKAGLSERRAELLAEAHGQVLEIGAGTGANLAHYPSAVTKVTLIEPDPHMAARLRSKLGAAPLRFEFDLVETSAERLPFEDARFDTVVSTLVLCTVADPERVLAEVARVLKPGGRMVLFEHVRDPENERRARWQDRIERPWGWIAGGCHPNRDTSAALEAAGFDVSSIEPKTFPKGGPVVKPMIHGSATIRSD